MGDDGLHRVDAAESVDDLLASFTALVGPLQFDLPGQSQREKRVAYRIQVVCVDDRRAHHVLLPYWRARCR